MPPWSSTEQRGVNDPVGPGASSPTWGQVQQLNSLEGVANLGTFGLYRPAKRAVIRGVTGIYDAAYGQPAEQQKQAYDQAAGQVRDFGRQVAGQYDQRGAQAINRFDQAGGAMNAYAQNRPTFSRTEQASARQRYANTPTNAQGFYNAYQAPSIAQNRMSTRQRVPMQLQGELGNLRSFAQGPTTSGGLLSNFQSRYGGSDQLDSRMGERRMFAGQPTETSSELLRLRNMDPSQSTRGVFGDVQGFDATQFSRGFTGDLQRGATQGGQMISDIVAGENQAGGLTRHLMSGNSESRQAMAGFDPTQTAGLRETYDRLRNEGPTYEEDFYTSQRDGTNPAYEMLKQDAQKQARDSAAARGGFVSGKAIDSENRTTARLAAEEFARRGELAATAGAARRDRLGQQLEGATALDSQLLGQRGLAADTALSREGMLGDLAMSSDQIRGNLAGQQDQLLGDLSMHQDVQGLSRLQTLGELGTAMDEQGLQLSGQQLQGATSQDDFLRRDQDAIDALSMKTTDRDIARDRNLTDLGVADDAAQTTRMGDFSRSLGTVDTNNLAQERDLDSLAGTASNEALEGGRIQAGAARDADSASMARDTNLTTLARDASTEQRDYYKDRFDQALQLGDKTSAMQSAYDMASMGALTQSELSAIEMQLARAGVDPATRQAFINNLIQIGSLGVKAAS